MRWGLVSVLVFVGGCGARSDLDDYLSTSFGPDAGGGLARDATSGGDGHLGGDARADSGTLGDATPRRDSGTLGDATPRRDSGTLGDATPRRDSGTPIDASSGLDVASPRDGTPPLDVTPVRDADSDSRFDALPDSHTVTIRAPRPLAPLSTATVTSQTPTLRWALPTGEDTGYVEICADRDCALLVTALMAEGGSGAPAAPLAPGVYYWRLTGVANGVIGTNTSPVWEFFVGHGDSVVDTSWGTTLDLNGDGFADVVVSAPSYANPDQHLPGTSETVYVFYGSAAGPAATPVVLTHGISPNDYQHGPVASAGDVNGDGFADLIIGTSDPDVDAGGGAYVYLGGPQGVSETAVALANQASPGAGFGWAVTSAGDVNGDGYADVIVTAPEAETPPSLNAIGEAFLYLGGPQGLSTTPTVLMPTGLPPGGQDAYYGHSAASAGDVNGDGFGDVIIGSYFAGYVYLYLGSAEGLSTTPILFSDPYTLPDGQTPSFGATLACAGDVNGDGYADIVVGAPQDGVNYSQTGNAFVFFGAAGGPSPTPLTLTLPGGPADGGVYNPYASFGGVVANGVDINADGFADLIIDTDLHTYIYLGSATVPATTPLVVRFPPSGDAFDQTPVAGAGDINGDGFADLVLGSPNLNGFAGAASVFLGSASGVSMNGIALAGPTAVYSLFGAGVQ